MSSVLSPAGTSDRPTFLAWAALVAGVLMVALLVLARVGGIGPSIAAGLLAGVALAKLRVEAMRRLRDAGFGYAMGPTVATGLTIALAGAAVRFLGRGSDAIVVALLVAAAAIAAILFSPSRPTRSRQPTGSGVPQAAVLVLLCGGLGFGLATWSQASQARHEADAEAAADYVPPADPFANSMPETGR